MIRIDKVNGIYYLNGFITCCRRRFLQNITDFIESGSERSHNLRTWQFCRIHCCIASLTEEIAWKWQKLGKQRSKKVEKCSFSRFWIFGKFLKIAKNFFFWKIWNRKNFQFKMIFINIKYLIGWFISSNIFFFENLKYSPNS